MHRDAAALGVAQDIMEAAPSIALLTLSGDTRGLVLYANDGAEQVLRMAAGQLLGRCALNHERWLVGCMLECWSVARGKADDARVDPHLNP